MHCTIAPDHPCFAGHFPGHPVLPGVLLLDRVLAVARAELNDQLAQCTVYNVKFLAEIGPGAELDIAVVPARAQEHKFTVHLQSDSAEPILACSGQLRLHDSSAAA